MADNILSDILFPVGATLRKVASGDVFGDKSGPVGADKAASATANQNARRNPSGIDMAAEAQKAAQRAGVGKAKAMPKPSASPVSTQGASSTPISSGAATRDHYTPRPFTGKISNND
jgi:hypothetical protein